MDGRVDPSDVEYPVAVSNAAQERAWDGAEGGLWAVHADLLEQMPARYDTALLDTAGITPGTRVLDVGCGTGSLTRAAARRAAPGPVVGVDLSAAMVDDVREPALFGRDPVAARDVMTALLGWLLDGRDADEARASLLATMQAHDGPDGVAFGSAAWLVAAVRTG